MLRNRTLLKAFAVFFVVEMIASTVWPTVSYALTAGPTAPEATSFEPVDTTDMVNTLTGDFVYNLPLLEVPGPSGGFPLSLSYHAGVMTAEEASWVGLGWTLNPGAINRNVNGYADDHKAAEQTTRFVWDGGIRHQAEVGVAIGIAGIAAITEAITVGYDTYQGFGVGGYINVSAGPNFGPASVRTSLTAGSDPFGGTSVSAGVNVGVGATVANSIQLSAGVGISTNFKSVSTSANAGASVSYGSQKSPGRAADDEARVARGEKPRGDDISRGGFSVMDASISSSGGKFSSSVGAGGASVQNSKVGKMSTRTSGFTLPLPFLHLGYRYTRYWIDEMEEVSTNGIFHNPTSAQDLEHFDDNAYDSYSLNSNYTLAKNEDPANDALGTLAAYDDYSVNAQGVAGSFKPHLLRGHTYRQNVQYHSGGSYKHRIIHLPTQQADDFENTPVQFRFVNDFSNRYQYDTDNLQWNSTSGDAVPITFEFNNPAQTGDGLIAGIQNDYLIGSKHIRHFTNQQITAGVPGFIETQSTGFVRQSVSVLAKQIGGFQIVNESGVTYHFSLPAYSREEFQYSEKKSDSEGDTYNYSVKPESYAHTWHLTAITGPDYVDRGTAGFDNEDWGYWVELDYGKWSNYYTWRNPGEANQRDIDENFVNFSDGVKEVYYLDAIRTKTHTAIFVKNIRDDAKSSLRILRNEVYTSDGTKLVVKGVNKAGGFVPQEIQNRNTNSIGANVTGSDYTTKPVSSLKLEKVLLFENQALATQSLSKSAGSDFAQSMMFTNIDYVPTPDVITYETVTQQDPDNVWDVDDIEAIETTLLAKALRVVEFDSDNSTLCPETPNSYNSNLILGSGNPSTNEANYTTTHKLALKEVRFLGKGGANLTPPVSFDYELSNPITGSGSLTAFDVDHQRYGLSNTTALNLGDIIKFTSGGKTCFATVYQTSPGRIQVIGKNLPTVGTTINWTTTKNPPYHKDSSDEWGLFKGDYVDFDNPNIDKTRTVVSKNQVDVWSLRKIHTSLGATISMEYESDMYQTSVFAKSFPLVISSMTDASTPQNPNRTYIIINCDDDMLDYFYNVNDKAEILMIYEQQWVEICGLPQYDTKNVYWMDGFIRSINQNSITVESNGLTDFLTQIWPVDLGVPNCTGGTRQHFREGNLLIRNPSVDVPGGDIRTTSVTIEDSFTDLTTRTSYDYKDMDSPTRTSGVTSYSPGLISKYDPDVDALSGTNSDVAKTEFKKQLYDAYSRLISRASEIPAPGIIYEYVGVRESIKNPGESTFTQAPNYTVYQFSVLKDTDVNHPLPTNMNSATYQNLRMDDQNGFDLDFSTNSNDKKFKNVLLKDYTTRVGELKSVTLFDNQNNKISETINHYLHDGLTDSEYETALATLFNNQGRIDETFVDARAARRDDDKFALLATVTQRQRFPSIGTGQTTINYKTGITSTSENLAYDFYSGKVVKTLSKDGHGNSYVAETTPAYRIYPMMGFAANGGYNMLTQDTRTATFKVSSSDINIKLGLLSTSAQTWSGEIPVLDNPELTGTMTFSNIYVKNSAGYYPARSSGLTVYLLSGERVRFVRSGYTYLAKVVSSIKNIPSNRYDYELQLITNPNEITSTATNISAQRLTVPRKHASYAFIGDDNVSLQADGLYPLTGNQLPTFTAWNRGDAVPANWQRNSELTLYDVYSHALEASDLNNQFAATKMSKDQTQIYTTVANARYKEFCYSGGEDAGLTSNGQAGGNVFVNGSLIATAHTGVKGVSATSGTRGFSFTISTPLPRTYKVSLWASQSGTTKIRYKLNNVQQTDPVVTVLGQSGTWYLLEAQIPITGSQSSLEIWCEANGSTTVYDDFRIRPLDAAMTSYVYNQWGELSHILDNNNLYTRFEYDGAGRLTATYRETLMRGTKTYGTDGLTKVSEVIYNYGKNN